MEAVAIRDRTEEAIINPEIFTGNLIITTTEISFLRGQTCLRLRIALKVFIATLRILFHMMGVIVFLRVSSISIILRIEISSCKVRIILITCIIIEAVMEIIMPSSMGDLELVIIMAMHFSSLILRFSKKALIINSSSSSCSCSSSSSSSSSSS